MPDDSPAPARWPRLLATRLAGPVDATQVADAAMGALKEIDGALHGVIGHGGVAALFQRSLALSSERHPWLAQEAASLLGQTDLDAWRQAIATQPPAEALAGAEAVFQAFHALLASLVGSPLTDRLLRAVWAHATEPPSAQDPAP